MFIEIWTIWFRPYTMRSDLRTTFYCDFLQKNCKVFSHFFLLYMWWEGFMQQLWIFPGSVEIKEQWGLPLTVLILQNPCQRNGKCSQSNLREKQASAALIDCAKCKAIQTTVILLHPLFCYYLLCEKAMYYANCLDTMIFFFIQTWSRERSYRFN